jgi:hypothetical protein
MGLLSKEITTEVQEMRETGVDEQLTYNYSSYKRHSCVLLQKLVSSHERHMREARDPQHTVSDPTKLSNATKQFYNARSNTTELSKSLACVKGDVSAGRRLQYLPCVQPRTTWLQ